MSVVLSVEDVGPWKKELKVEVPQPAVDAELQRVIGEYASQVRLPGFRKGKVPAKVVRQRFRQEIEQAVVERLVPRYWHQAQAEKSLVTLGEPRVENVVDFEDGKPLVFTATVEVRPDIELSDDLEFELPPLLMAVGDGEVREVLERMQNDLSPFGAVERAAAVGDQVQLRLVEGHDHEDDKHEDHDQEDVEEQGEADGERSEDGAEDSSTEEKGQVISVEVGDPKVWEELSLAVTGLKAGQSGDFTHAHEAAHEEGEEPHQHSHSFQFEVLEVQEKDLITIDDELAKQVGDFETLEALEAEITTSLERDKEMRGRRERESSLLDQLREKYPLELPVGVVESETEDLLREFARDVVSRGGDLERAGIDWNDMRERFQPNAEKRVHARLLLDAIASSQEVEVSDEELQAAIESIARSDNQSPTAVRTALDRDGRLEGLKGQMVREKALRSLLGEESTLIAGPADEAGTDSADEDESADSPDQTDE